MTGAWSAQRLTPNVWKKDTEPSIAEPFNKNNHMGVCALRLFRITGEEKWRDRAFKIFAYTKSRFQLVDDGGFSYYVWNYWEPFGPESVDLAKKDTRHWMNVHGGRPYNAGEIGQMVEAYNTGVVFDKTDIERFLNTNLKIMWNGDKAKPHFSIANWKLPMPTVPTASRFPRRPTAPAPSFGPAWPSSARPSGTWPENADRRASAPSRSTASIAPRRTPRSSTGPTTILQEPDGRRPSCPASSRRAARPLSCARPASRRTPSRSPSTAPTARTRSW